MKKYIHYYHTLICHIFLCTKQYSLLSHFYLLHSSLRKNNIMLFFVLHKIDFTTIILQLLCYFIFFKKIYVASMKLLLQESVSPSFQGIPYSFDQLRNPSKKNIQDNFIKNTFKT